MQLSISTPLAAINFLRHPGFLRRTQIATRYIHSACRSFAILFATMAPKRKAAAIAANTYSDSTGSKANARSEASTTPTKRPKLSQMTLDGGISSMKAGFKKASTITPFLNGATPSSSNGTASRNNISSNPGPTNPKIKYSHDFSFGSSDHCIERAFYPPEMSNERCAKYNANELPRPIEVLQKAIAETKVAREAIRPGKAVLHWFKRDLRISDNRALAMASQKAKETGASLICVFVFSPQDYQAHLTSPVRVDFERRSLEVMKKDLADLDIPLYVYTVEHRSNIPGIFIAQCVELWDVKHVFCNIEYEVDELRREAKMTRMCLEKGINFTAVHDDVVVTPGELKTGSGKQYAVYTPWYKNWLAHVNSHPHIFEAAPRPEKNPPIARQQFDELFCKPIPAAPENKKLAKDEKIRFAKLWPAGEHEALARVTKFISEKSKNYKDSRNYPDLDGTAKISVHLSSGTLSARTCIRLARQAQSANKLGEGIETWISEVAWRDFYKHVLVHWPYVCMYKPFKYEYSNIEWEYSQDLFFRWCGGKTGFPIVDAAMRQMNQTGWMHNRLRMIVASFLAKDLLLDWRLGERHFMLQLIDGDFASNNGGWGFSASVGVDPQPYFRIFNPLLQSEKFDPTGAFIRKWVPELAKVEGKAIHDPYGRKAGIAAKKAGYPEPCVVHKEARERALKRYKEGIGRDTA